MTKWTQEDIDRITNKDDKKVNTSQPTSFALGRMKAGQLTGHVFAFGLDKKTCRPNVS